MGRPRQQTDDFAILQAELSDIKNQLRRPIVQTASRAVYAISLVDDTIKSVVGGASIALLSTSIGAGVEALTGAQVIEQAAAAGVVAGGALALLACVSDIVGGIHVNVNFNINYDVTPEGAADRIAAILTEQPQIERVDRVLPVRQRETAMQNKVWIREPGTKSANDGGRAWDKQRLQRFLIRSFTSGDWTRDTWTNRGVGQKEWAELRDMLEPLGVWQTADRPILDGFISSLRDG